MYLDLHNIGVIIEDKDYAAIVMQSIPSTYADFCANIAAAAQLVRVDLTVDKLQHQLEQEFDRRKAHQNHQPQRQKDAAFSADANSKSGNSSKNRGQAPGQKKELCCWNCDAVGHRKNECPKPIVEKEQKGNKDKKESANAAKDVEEGSWMAIVHQPEDLYDTDWLTEVDDDDWSSRSKDFDCFDDPDFSMAAIEDVEVLQGGSESAQTAAVASCARPVRNELYDSGTTCHMSPDRDRFLTYREIPPKPISGANQQKFYAIGTGDIRVSVPNRGKKSTIRLTEVLHAPKIGVTLISIGRIDEAGYSCLFSGGSLSKAPTDLR
jgi:hypothetical protein